MIEIHNQIVQSGYPNYLGCRIPVKSGINVDFFRENLIDYDDEIICEFLQFGAPIGYQGEMLNEGSSKVKNHKGATDFHDEILAYLLKEATYGAIIGPFDKNPFSCHFKISPLNSVYKKDSVERRVILDLSFPPGRSVNDFISKDVYLGERVQLSYPKVDDLVGIIKDKGGKCLVFKKDLKRAYRQIPIDPGDLHLVGFQWDNKLFADRVLPMGLRSSALICQRITTAVSFMFYKMGYMVINYLDDFGGADTVDKADEAYIALGALLDSCGLEESKQKGVAPTTRMEFLGITVDTVKLTLEVTSDRVLEISLLVQAWLRKKKASLRELQSILGKLHFVSTCVRPGRLFVSRLLNWLRSAFPSNVVGSGHKIYRKIPVEVQKDLLWWHRFLSSYNGISMMSLEDWSSPDEIFSSDACLEGFGAITSNQYFHAVFPSDITKDQLHINCLELLAIVVAVKIWGKTFCGKKILIFCDNEASVQVINSGSSKDAFMQTCLRELCFIQASFQFEVRARHILGVENRLADYLSRWHCSHKYRELFKSAISVDRYEEVPVLMSDFSFLNNW
ncbi:Hypothetical predicted protein [Mytilus galloprovincialis]|uniref:Reverse transcriptase domain-containing protein n=1 Tax=Mytilus galloprovincialis TaxID=29158 RepID=A0A8B6BJZ4_MYTGA|nr:Hypothetical predicted protein [Mytilus galloprovincialis]